MLRALVRASHPEPALAVTIVGALLAAGAGLTPTTGLAVAGTVLASQLAVGWLNDAIDAPRDTAVARTDKPVATGAVSRRAVAVAGGLAAAALLVIAFAAVPRAAPIALLGLGSALLYNWPLKSTVVSPLPYAVSFACLPAFVLSARPGGGVPLWIVAAGALLGAGAHFANVVPDLADDARTGVRGLPHRLGARGSLLVGAALLLAATALLVFGPPGPPSVLALVAGSLAVAVLPIGGYVVTRDPGSRIPFRSVMLIAVLDVVLLVTGGMIH
jgi:4-hydroxybenzoate polyprenyltransferase